MVHSCILQHIWPATGNRRETTERFFPEIKYIKPKIQTKITDENLENSLRFSLSNTKADIDSLVVQVAYRLDCYVVHYIITFI